MAAVVSTDPIAVRLNETFAIFKRTLPFPARCNKLFSVCGSSRALRRLRLTVRLVFEITIWAFQAPNSMHEGEIAVAPTEIPRQAGEL